MTTDTMTTQTRTEMRTRMDNALEDVILHHTGHHVSLAGLSPRETVFCLFLALVDDAVYDGANAGRCLVGQVVTRLERAGLAEYQDWHAAERLAALIGADLETEYRLREIYYAVVNQPYVADLPASLDLARQILGLSDAPPRETPTRPVETDNLAEVAP